MWKRCLPRPASQRRSPLSPPRIQHCIQAKAPGSSGRARGWAGWARCIRAWRGVDVEGDAFLFELRLEGVRTARAPVFRELSRFPASRRDISILVDKAATARELQACIRRHGGERLREVRLFDLYQGKGVAEGQKV